MCCFHLFDHNRGYEYETILENVTGAVWSSVFDGDGKNMFAPVLFLELQEMLVSS